MFRYPCQDRLAFTNSKRRENRLSLFVLGKNNRKMFLFPVTSEAVLSANKTEESFPQARSRGDEAMSLTGSAVEPANKAEAFALLCEQKPEWLARIARRATAAHAARRDLEEIFQNACLKAHEHWEG